MGLRDEQHASLQVLHAERHREVQQSMVTEAVHREGRTRTSKCLEDGFSD